MFPQSYNDRIDYTNFHSRKHYVDQPLNDAAQRRQLDAMRGSHRSYHGVDYVKLYIRSTHNYALITQSEYPLSLGPKKAVELVLEWFSRKNPKVFNSGNFIVCHE